MANTTTGNPPEQLSRARRLLGGDRSSAGTRPPAETLDQHAKYAQVAGQSAASVIHRIQRASVGLEALQALTPEQRLARAKHASRLGATLTRSRAQRDAAQAGNRKTLP